MENLTRTEWEEVKKQNIQLAKQYHVNLLIAEAAIKVIDAEMSKILPEEKIECERPVGVI